jgi:hypothetical protein
MGCVVQTGGARARVWEEHHDRSAWQFVLCYYYVLGQTDTERGHQTGALHGHRSPCYTLSRTLSFLAGEVQLGQ